MDNLTEIITYFALLSVAAERLTDILKKAYLDRLWTVNASVYQGISAVFGGFLAYYAPMAFMEKSMPAWCAVVITGLAVSGGSSFWHTILSTMSEVKTKVAITNSNLKQ